MLTPHQSHHSLTRCFLIDRGNPPECAKCDETLTFELVAGTVGFGGAVTSLQVSASCWMTMKLPLNDHSNSSEDAI